MPHSALGRTELCLRQDQNFAPGFVGSLGKAERNFAPRNTLPARFEVIAVPDGKPRTKPRALNVALPLARGDLLVVYDAEDVPDPGQLRLAAEIFAHAPPSTACLQGRLVIDNPEDSWISRCFAIEYAGLFDVLNPALAHWHLPMPLGGTSMHVRGIR